MDRPKSPLCWIEQHAGNPGNPASSSPQYEKLCAKIWKLLLIEKKAVGEYSELLAEIQRVVPEARRQYFFEIFMAATADDEEKHIKLLERLKGIFECRGSSSGSNPGNPGNEVYAKAGEKWDPLDIPGSAKIKCPRCGHIDELSNFALLTELKCPSCGARIPFTEDVEIVEDVPLHWEPGGSSGSNPYKVERWKRRRSLAKVADDLTDNDAVTDALWDMRGNILQALKEMGQVSPEATGPEVQGTIDYLIRRLVFLV